MAYSSAPSQKSKSDLLNGRKFDTSFSQSRIDEEIADWNKDDQCNRIKLSHNLRGHALMLHRVGLSREIVVDLVVSDPVERVP